MMTTLKVRFDGHVLVPEQPVVLPQDRVLEIYVEDDPTYDASAGEPLKKTPLLELVEALKDLPYDPNSPTDGAAQHDHYLYGTPKRP
jgi:hypothetical protein